MSLDVHQIGITLVWAHISRIMLHVILTSHSIRDQRRGGGGRLRDGGRAVVLGAARFRGNGLDQCAGDCGHPCSQADRISLIVALFAVDISVLYWILLRSFEFEMKLTE